MRPACAVRALAAATLVAALSASAADKDGAALRRFALVAGANDGGPGRVRLRYATSDAESVAHILVEMGGVSRADRTLLAEPTIEEFRKALAGLRRKLVEAKGKGERTEAIIYYSGHSDEEGLLFKGELYTYTELREAVKGLPADVRIAILDSCASGALTRSKGGVKRPAFLVDSSSKVEGHAFLTSSSVSEAAQESDMVGGSFFTHYLVSGLRGAADTSRDGRVTLSEAYGFAFNETLARTEKTMAGAQHPNYDFQLAGSGDVVLTDLRGTSAGLVIPKGMQGRFFIRDAQGRLVAELTKPADREIEIGLEPGKYVVTVARGKQYLEAGVALSDGTRKMLAEGDFAGVKREAAVARGDVQPRDEGDIERVHFRLSAVPAWSTNGFGSDADDVLVNAQFSALGGRSTGIRGVEAGGVFNLVDEDVRGVSVAGVFDKIDGNLRGAGGAGVFHLLGGDLTGAQGAGIFGIVRGNVSGVQGAGIFNIAGGHVYGAQGAGIFNMAGGSVTGAEVGGIFNLNYGHVTGIEVGGIFNISGGHISGGEVGGIFNVAGEGVSGVQVAGIFNAAGQQSRGLQLAGIYNQADDFSGLQLAGIANVATGRMHGVQLGLVNVAEDSDAPIGLVNIIEKGMLHLDLFASETFPLSYELRTGGRYLYSVLSVSVAPQSAPVRWACGAGLGGQVPFDPFFLNVDLVYNHVQYGLEWNDVDFMPQARLWFGWEFARHMALFVGASYNLFVTDKDGRGDLAPWTVRERKVDGYEVREWPGVFGGIQL
ncbi:MAG: caspase family protein [Deltaproteobacteria bacterium]|nr:caspase family protein [Deltaproteobacteria bacterium]